jgi:ribosome maturation factor RimP
VNGVQSWVYEEEVFSDMTGTCVAVRTGVMMDDRRDDEGNLKLANFTTIITHHNPRSDVVVDGRRAPGVPQVQ